MLRLNIAFDEVQRTSAFHRSALPTRMKGTHALGVAKLLPFALLASKNQDPAVASLDLSKMGPKPEQISEEQLRDTNTLFSIS